MFQTKFEYKIKAHILCSIISSTFMPYTKRLGTRNYRQAGHLCQNNTAQFLC